MEYAFLEFNDDLKIKINGIGLVTAIILYPSLWKLYMKKMELHADYLIEIIKGLNGQNNMASKIEREMSHLNHVISDTTIAIGCGPVICVVKINEDGQNSIVQDLITGTVYYVKTKIFEENITSEFEAKKFQKTGGIINESIKCRTSK